MKKLLFLVLSIISFPVFSMTIPMAVRAGEVIKSQHRKRGKIIAQHNVEHNVEYPNNWIQINSEQRKKIKNGNDERYPISKEDLDKVIDLIEAYQNSGTFKWLFTESTLILKNARQEYENIRYKALKCNPNLSKWMYKDSKRTFPKIVTVLLWAHNKEGNCFNSLPLELIDYILRFAKPGHEELFKLNRVKQECLDKLEIGTCRRCDGVRQLRVARYGIRLPRTEKRFGPGLTKEQAKKTADKMLTSDDGTNRGNNYTIWLEPKAFLYLADNLPGEWHKEEKFFYSKMPIMRIKMNNSGQSYTATTHYKTETIYQRKMTIDGQEYTFESDINRNLYWVNCLPC